MFVGESGISELPNEYTPNLLKLITPEILAGYEYHGPAYSRPW